MDTHQYTRVQRQLHWWVAALIAVQYLGQNAMRSAMDRVDQATTPALTDFLITTGHSLMGMSALVLIIWRLRLRRQNPKPTVAGQGPLGWVLVARAWHLSLYLAMALMAISGAVSYYIDFQLATRVHELGKWVLGTFVIGHILAGFAHWLIFKDQVLQGMLGKRRDADIIRRSDRSTD